MKKNFTNVQKGLLQLVSMLETKIPAETTPQESKTSTSSPNQTGVNKASSGILEELAYNKYAKFLKKLERVEIEDSVFVHCSLLFKKVMSKRKRSLKKKDVIRVFGVCLFISFKYVIDDLLFYVQDYCTLTGMNQEMVEVLEVAIVVNIIGFELNFGSEEYLQEKRNLELLGAQ